MKEHKHFNMRRLLTVALMLALVLSGRLCGRSDGIRMQKSGSGQGHKDRLDEFSREQST